MTSTEINAAAGQAADALAILALAALPELDYARQRETEAKRLNVTLAVLDRAVTAAKKHGSGEQEPPRPKHADMLLAIASRAELFHDPASTGFADIRIHDHRETWPIRSTGFRRWLAREFFAAHRTAPNADAMTAAIAVLDARAHFDAPQRATWLRVGEHEGRLYLDLCDDAWRAVEVDSAGWRVVAAPPVRFRRTAGMLALPEPTADGALDDLRPFLNVRRADGADGGIPASGREAPDDDAGFILALAWLLAAFRPDGPYPVLVLAGEHGSAKTTFATLLRLLIDPNSSPLRSLPREDRDFFIAACNSHVQGFDNLSHLRDWTSDTMCRLATGGGFAVRSLYTDGDEALFCAMRPILLNGIEDFVSRPDLADRSLFLDLAPIADDRRLAQRQLLARFETARAGILGALLDVVSHGLRELPRTRLARLPRMADFAVWSTACGDGAVWPRGAFAAAYEGNRAAAIAASADNDLVASAVRRMAERSGAWEGTAEQLLAALQPYAGVAPNNRNWPSTARGISGRLRRAAPGLRKLGLGVEFDRGGHERSRLISIAPAVGGGIRPSAPSAPFAEQKNQENSAHTEAALADGMRTVRTVESPPLLPRAMEETEIPHTEKGPKK